MIELSANQMTFKCYIFGKMTGLVGVAKCDFVSELTRPKLADTTLDDNSGGLAISHILIALSSIFSQARLDLGIYRFQNILRSTF